VAFTNGAPFNVPFADLAALEDTQFARRAVLPRCPMHHVRIPQRGEEAARSPAVPHHLSQLVV
jgi:hypothetical protein